MKITKELLTSIGVGNTEIIKYAQYLELYSEQFEINTIKRIQSFIPNLLHESMNFKAVKEFLPKNKPDYVKAIGNYFGRGLMQVTWKRNYLALTEWCKINLPGFKDDFVANPALLETPQYAVLSAFWYWKVNRLAVFADRGDFDNVCSLINRGKVLEKAEDVKFINGYDDRKKKLALVDAYFKTHS